MSQITVVKVGGNVVDNPALLARFVKDFAALPGQKILVHGGGKEATRLSAALGIETKMIEGRRVTDRETLDVVTMVYAGLVNKRIVAALQAAGCNAIGLSGADAGVITSVRRAPNPVDYGYVGDISRVDSTQLAAMLAAGMVPVFCAITHDGAGTLLNSNADGVASAVAVAASTVAPTTLVYCFEMPGVMRDVADPTSVIPRISREVYSQLRADGVVNKGMIPKIDNAFRAVESGVESVVIKSAENLCGDIGTTIK
jgi:acetylglutamate kinase